MRYRVILGQQGRQLAHSGHHRRENSQIGVERRFLRHVADTQARLPPDFAIVQPAVPGQRAQQGRFTGAVSPDQRDPFTGIELKIGLIEKRHVAEGKRSVGKNQVRHERGRLSSRKSGERRASILPRRWSRRTVRR
jgi:hypothetical protein